MVRMRHTSKSVYPSLSLLPSLTPAQSERLDLYHTYAKKLIDVRLTLVPHASS